MGADVTAPATSYASDGETVASFMLGKRWRNQSMESIIQRALTYHPSITRRVMELRVVWNHNLQTAAGRFHSAKNQIELHPGLAYAHQANKLEETFLHELAHAMQWYAYSKCDHAESWWEMMHLLATTPKRCHNEPMCQARLTPARAGLKAEDLGL